MQRSERNSKRIYYQTPVRQLSKQTDSTKHDDQDERQCIKIQIQIIQVNEHRNQNPKKNTGIIYERHSTEPRP